jgi:nickel-dependent lactate racemase
VALDQALANPIASVGLGARARSGDRVLVVVSDATRDEPRREFLGAIRERLPEGVKLTVAIANGTHEPGAIDALGLGNLSGIRVVNHDSRRDEELVLLGSTARGTPVRVNRCVVECDLAVLTGQIKPHYFAGYGAGAKAIFPGLGGNDEIRKNHELKREPGSRIGVVERNSCRADLEEATALAAPNRFLLNTVVDEDGGVQGAVAGDVDLAFRAGAELCGALYRVRGQARRAVVVSDKLPMTSSLYQASKLVAAAAPLLADHGTMVVVAQCPLGVGPVETVNKGIYELGIKPLLPAKHRILLVSDMADEVVRASYCEPTTLEVALKDLPEAPIVVPRASTIIVEGTR